MIYEWLSRVSGDRDNDGIDCESHNNPNGYIPSAPVEPPVETSTCSADAETWRGLKVCDERPRDGYDRDAFGTSYSSLEGEIIAPPRPVSCCRLTLQTQSSASSTGVAREGIVLNQHSTDQRRGDHRPAGEPAQLGARSNDA